MARIKQLEVLKKALYKEGLRIVADPIKTSNVYQVFDCHMYCLKLFAPQKKVHMMPICQHHSHKHCKASNSLAHSSTKMGQ